MTIASHDATKVEAFACLPHSELWLVQGSHPRHVAAAGSELVAVLEAWEALLRTRAEISSQSKTGDDTEGIGQCLT
jgi:hypothetical protein